MPRRLLLIEDDHRLAAMVVDYLAANGYAAQTHGTAAAGLAALAQEPFDLVILDLMLPDADGLQVCRTIRARSAVPVVMLTAKGDPMDRVIGLEVGADDYLPKPFEPRELLARIRAVLRRHGASAAPGGPGALDAAGGAVAQAANAIFDEPAALAAAGAPGASPAQATGRGFIGSPADPATDAGSGSAVNGAALPLLRFGRLQIDRDARAVRVDGAERVLTAHQFALLVALAERAGRVLSREQIMDAVRGEPLEAFDRSIDVHIARIRAAIEDDPKQPRRIITVRGAGYVFARSQDA
jgi:DNA-binding response OmpR family regulator